MKNPIQQIHILKNRLALKGVPRLSEETYRALLQESYQVTSSKDLSLTQQKELKDMMSAVLIRTRCTKVSTSLLNSQFISFHTQNQLSLKQKNFILFLSQGRPLGKDKVSNLSAYCSKIIKRSIAHIDELSKSEAIIIINTLQRYYKTPHEVTSIH